MPFELPAAIESARLLVRLVEETDLPQLLLVNGDDEVTRYVPYATWKSLADAQAWYVRMSSLHAAGTTLQMVVVDKGSRQVIGTCLLFRYERDSERAELGYVLGRPYWGQGYMREALRTLIAHAFGPLSLRRLEAEVDPRNARSCQLLETLKFQSEALLRQRWRTKGELCDTRIYGLLNQGFEYVVQ